VKVSVYLPWVAAALLALATPWLARRLSPSTAVTALGASAAATAAASTWSLALLSAALLEHTPPVEERITTRTVPVLVSILAITALTVLVQRAARVVRVRTRTTAALHRVCALCPDAGELAVTQDPAVYAFAVPGRPGRILVSSGLLTSSTLAERRVVLAHERSHLRRGHHRFRAAIDLAAAVNPLLTVTRDAVAYLSERAADEDAATAVGSRVAAARALTDVVLRTHPNPGTQIALAFHRHAVLQRVRALRQPPTRSLATLTALCALGAVATIAAAVDATASLAKAAAAVTGF